VRAVIQHRRSLAHDDCMCLSTRPIPKDKPPSIPLNRGMRGSADLRDAALENVRDELRAAPDREAAVEGGHVLMYGRAAQPCGEFPY